MVVHFPGTGQARRAPLDETVRYGTSVWKVFPPRENCYPMTMPTNARPASLRDVAERAGVSVATASRVVSGSAGVRPETRERVERAVRELLDVAPGRSEGSGAIGL